MSQPYGAVMRWALRTPCVDKPTRTESKTVSAIGIADFQDLALHTITLSDQQLEVCLRVLDD